MYLPQLAIVGSLLHNNHFPETYYNAIITKQFLNYNFGREVTFRIQVVNIATIVAIHC